MSGATGVLAGAAIAGAATSAYGISQQSKAAKDAKSAAANAKVDISALDAQTREIARRNALESSELERLLTPEVPQLRTAANEAVLGGIGGSDDQRQAVAMLMSRFGQPVVQDRQMSTPLLNEAIAKARADLALGGKLSLDQRNEATRRGASTAGSVTGGLGLGRDLAARDLGLTSYGVEQQRFQNAAGLSPLELNRESTQLNYGLNRDVANNSNFLNQFGLLNSYYNNLRSQDLAAAQYGQSIAPPIVGLDPSAVANIAVGNQNNQTQAAMGAAGIRGQQGGNLTQMGGQLIGYGLMGGFGNLGNGSSTVTGTGGAPTGGSYLPSNVYICWTAREVYGHDNPEWMEFRNWLLNESTPEFREFYIKNGEDIASQIKSLPLVKDMIRHLMTAVKL